MSIQLLNNNARQFKSNNSPQIRQQSNPVINNTGDTVSFTAKATEKNGLLKTLKSAALAIPLALTPAGVNANLHPYLYNDDAYQTQPERPTSQNVQDNNSTNEELPPIDNEYLRAIACLKDTIKPGGPGFLIEFPEANLNVNLFLDKSGNPFVKFQVKDIPDKTFEIDSSSGYIKYPTVLEDGLKQLFENIYESATKTLLESGQCDANIKNITVE